ncbi:hypothetical protein Halru_3017 [Halovivax ruber XH-70]|uniref:Uncharacterized protein n=1 Tax=Halovivax ruber (strain DSM 18193 / JCM 13892 / XH-70) TaxID=797302 RepID=L0IFG4_HALRX|nr:hypothetical protein [Halovivax ruber]AGB17583.1 hypothetical protein Halru_3017 [Halovivax ruber XH-70]
MSSTLRLNRSLKYETFPHQCKLGELELRIENFSIDGDETVEADDDSNLDLTDYSGWSTIEFSLSVDVPADLLEEVLPEASESTAESPSASHPAKVIVAGHCVDTYTRAGTVLGDDISAGTVSDSLTISSEDITQRVDLNPYLLRSEPLSEEKERSLGLDRTHDYATEPGAFLSDGRRCRITVEDEEAGSDDVLQVERTSFEEENENEDTVFPPADRMYYLDLKRDPNNPVLYFNEDHDQVVDIVWNGEGRYDDLTAELIWDQVMSSVWGRMTEVAAHEYDPDADEWDPEWQPAVFEMLTDYLYEDQDLSPRKAAEYLKEELEESPMTATEQIEQAVQGLLNPGQQLDNHARRVGDR